MKVRRVSIFTVLVIAALLIYALASLINIQNRLREAEAAREALRLKVQELSAVNDTLEYEIEHSEDPETIEEVAREKLGLVLPGEIIFYDMSN
jgi:cell division protein FtsL